MATENEDAVQIEKKKNKDWVHSKWRPVVAWTYVAICIFDFIFFPLISQAITAKTHVELIWNPNTLKGGGIFHMAMLTIVGVTAWGRSQEKLNLFKFDSNEESTNRQD